MANCPYCSGVLDEQVPQPAPPAPPRYKCNDKRKVKCPLSDPAVGFQAMAGLTVLATGLAGAGVITGAPVGAGGLNRGGGNAGGGANSGSITGKVTDRESKHPIRDVVISVDNVPLVKTNMAGNYGVKNVDGGSHDISAEHLLYERGFQLTHVRGGRLTKDVNFQLQMKEEHHTRGGRAVKIHRDCLVEVVVKNSTDENAENIRVNCDNESQKIVSIRAKQRGIVSFNMRIPQKVGRTCIISASSKTHDSDPDKHELDIGPHDTKKTVTFTLKKSKPSTSTYSSVLSRQDISKMMGPVFLIAAGIVLGILLGDLQWTWGFILLAASYVMPDPAEFNAEWKRLKKWELQKDTIKKNVKQLKDNFVGSAKNRRSSGFGFLKSGFKAFGIVLIALALFNSNIPMSNLLVLILLLITYYEMGIEWELPHEYMESLWRFIIGIIFIPFAFLLIFDSWILAIIAWAFFAIPPIRRRASEIEETFSELPLKLIFLVLMLIALAGSGVLGFDWIQAAFPTWELGGTSVLGSLFIYFWVVSFIAGLFSPAITRPYTGFIMLGAAIVIFAAGPGTQEFGQALLGEWFPTIENMLAGATSPLAELLGGLSTTFTQAITLITCPSCFAQGIINGTYQTDPDTGLAGAYGVEIMSFKTNSQIYAEQMYVINAKLENKGAYTSDKIFVYMYPAGKAAEKETDFWGTGGKVSMKEMGFITDTNSDMNCPDDYKCTVITPGGAGSRKVYGWAPITSNAVSVDAGKCPVPKPEGCYHEVEPLEKLEPESFFFTSMEGVSCKTVAEYELKEKFIPFELRIDYDYKIDSTLPVEFISEAEWDRQVKQGTLKTSSKKQSTFSNSPVMLNIDTMEQPIKEGTNFYLQMSLGPADSGDVSNAEIVLELPEDFGVFASSSLFDFCSPAPKKAISTDTRLVWTEDELKGNYIIYCTAASNLLKMTDKGIPEKTYTLKAHSEYTFTETNEMHTKLEFGGIRCCPKPGEAGECPGGELCQIDYRCGFYNVQEILNKYKKLQDAKAQIENFQGGYTKWLDMVLNANLADLLLEDMEANRKELNGLVANVEALIATTESMIANADYSTMTQTEKNQIEVMKADIEALKPVVVAYKQGIAKIDQRIAELKKLSP